MNLRQAEDYLLGLELFGMRFGLDRMHKLMTVLGMPQRRFASIHVVGTNGKSSTARMTAAILERHGLRSGVYTSPHLRGFPERIEVGGQPLADAAFADAVDRAAHAAELVNRTLPDGDDVTQFEALTAAAFHALAAAGVEVAVIEAGLGGRYDATNVIPSKVQVLTSVGLDHTRWLGDTIADIAAEKLAVVRDHGTLVIPPDLAPDAQPIAEEVAREKHATIVRAQRDVGVTLAARGAFQRRNFALAAATSEAFLEHPLDHDAVAEAAAAVMVPGRMEVVGDDPLVILDGAHNGAGMAALADALPEVIGDRPLTVVISILDDKDSRAMMGALLPLAENVVFTRTSNARALSPGTLAHLAERPDAVTVGDPKAALERAKELAGSDGAVLATGSIYLIADLVRVPGEARVSMI
ncbi:MAG: dihydrofolate synthase / folylpolyglutamate synthase [Thermoleophilaceae bacterium]|nr:dihydrofolate synthase / folylpolyglutamate synthase [Thermoleophilaceae bacterium]